MTEHGRPEGDEDPELLAIDELAEVEKRRRLSGGGLKRRSTTLIVGAVTCLVALAIFSLWIALVP